ncbi:MAG: single-stranded DNA-binding protein [Nonomuraea muscovyensis]|jgi:single-strand DNA-binding protein|nr:single-stranded DNA-binding protein [Nonomuraea muscovyensis]
MTGALVTIDGNITADPELRYTQAGVPVATFNVAHTPRRLNKQTQEWEDAGDTLFLRVNVWREQGENVSASLKKGNAVQVIGRLVARNWEKDGQPRTSIECDADIVSLDLRRQRIDSVQRIRRDDAPAPDGEPWGVAPGQEFATRSAARSTAAA